MNALGKFPSPAEAASPAPTDLAITVRDRRFSRVDKPRWWLNGDPIATAWLHSLSATFPRGEAFFIESVKAFREGVSPQLAEEIRAFVAQEINHSREHIAFNRSATDAGYDLSAIDAHVVEWLEITRSRPMIFNLAATIALEHFTAMMAHEFLLRPEYFEGAHPDSAAMWRWHAIEEIEHKGVAYDTYLHATRGWSRWKRWKLKSLVMLAVTRDFVHNRIRDTLQLLAQDGITGPRVRWKLLAYLFWSPGVLRRILPAWLGYFRPGFHPWNHDDRALIARAAADFADPEAAT
ncbi:metal-dependent hydrolase [Novosphingobium sp. PS1R-30]|uniref:Metal-dependent hydrolase n=1 Tax=Novosphingobium anseongense TaxID=3133436 RepID=A0ABU8RZY6_9SPHN